MSAEVGGAPSNSQLAEARANGSILAAKRGYQVGRLKACSAQPDQNLIFLGCPGGICTAVVTTKLNDPLVRVLWHGFIQDGFQVIYKLRRNGRHRTIMGLHLAAFLLIPMPKKKAALGGLMVKRIS